MGLTSFTINQFPFIDLCIMIDSLSRTMLYIIFWKYKFPKTNSHIRLLADLWLNLVGRSVIIAQKEREATLPCSYRSTCILWIDWVQAGIWTYVYVNIFSRRQICNTKLDLLIYWIIGWITFNMLCFFSMDIIQPRQLCRNFITISRRNHL